MRKCRGISVTALSGRRPLTKGDLSELNLEFGIVGKEVVDESRKCPMCGSTTWVLLDGHSILQALEGGLEALAYSCDECGFIRWHRMDKERTSGLTSPVRLSITTAGESSGVGPIAPSKTLRGRPT